MHCVKVNSLLFCTKRSLNQRVFLLPLTLIINPGKMSAEQEFAVQEGDAESTVSAKQRSYSSSSVSTTSGSPLFYSTGINNSIEHTDSISLLDLLDPISSNLLAKKYTQVKEKSLKKYEQIKQGTSRRKDKYISEIRDFDGLKQRLLERVDKLDHRLSGLFVASKTEKAFYSFSLFSVLVAGYLLGKSPESFHVYYTSMAFILLPIRVYTYWKRSFHYFLADLCYFVNFLLLTFIWIAPQSVHLYTVCFAFTFGTLSWAVITWRNSLVLHSIDKFTSSFIHIFPPVVVFVVTHLLPYELKLERFPGAAKLTRWNFISGILWTSFYYLIWQSLYHYFITFRRAEKIKAGRVTSFEWLRKSMGKSFLGKFVNSLPGPLPVVAFTFIQYGYQLLTMSVCPLFFYYKPLASGFMIFIFLVASYNGATYYVDYYGKRLEKEVARLQKEIAELQQYDSEKNDKSGTNLKDLNGGASTAVNN